METKIFVVNNILNDNFEFWVGKEPPIKNNVNQCFEPNNCRCIGTLEKDEAFNNFLFKEIFEGLTFENSPREILKLTDIQ